MSGRLHGGLPQKSTESLDTPPTCNTPEVHKTHRRH